MKITFLVLSAAALLASCNQAAPVTSAPTVAAPEQVATPDAPASVDSVQAAATTLPTDGVTSTTPTAPAPAKAETIRLAFRFKPSPDPDNPSHPRTSAYLLLQGAKPQEIDLGKFVGQPDVVNVAKAKAANFPPGMLLGFRSYSAATGTSQDLAVLNVDGHHLRIVQRRVEETAPEASTFETSREIPLPGNPRVVAAPTAK
jgi:hypothetical protein